MFNFENIYRDRKVFITGITGFKGSWLASILVKLGAEVTGYALKPPTNPNHFDLLNLDLSVIYDDIRNEKNLTEAIISSKAEIIFHLAAQPLVRYSYSNPKETFETNLIGTLNLFESCKKSNDVKAIINITSDKCYENKEWIWPYRENEPMGGFDPYSASKGCAELLTSCYRESYFNIEDFGKKHQILMASCRAGNVIGGGDWATDRLVPDTIKAASEALIVEIRSPHALRPWQHVLDPLTGYLLLGKMLFERKIEYSGPWNFGPDDQDNKEVGIVVEEMQKNWQDIRFKLGSGVTNLHEANLLKLDSSKAKMKLGWKSIWDFETTIKMTINWYKTYYENASILTNEQIDKYFDDVNHINNGKKNEI